MNHMIHIAAISQIRVDSEGRTYYRRKRAEGKKLMEAARCLKRRTSDAILRQLAADQQRADLDQVLPLEAGPGGHCGASQESSAAGSHSHTSTSDQPLHGPAQPTPRPTPPARKTEHTRQLEPTP
jgi:transposase